MGKIITLVAIILFAVVPHARAASLVDDLVIENQSVSHGALVEYFRELFRNHAWYWTESDLRDLGKIIIVENKSDIGTKGLYDWTEKYATNGKLMRWIGIIYIWGGGPAGEALAHEYGHHYTSYWAAMRTNGGWNDHWPVDAAGDYYKLRPLPAACSCETASSCSYRLDPWEIIAEDFRTLVPVDPILSSKPHFSISTTCPGTSMKVGTPDPAGTLSYLRTLPLSGNPLPPVVTGAPTTIPTVTWFTQPTPTTRVLRLTIPCPTSKSDVGSIQLGIGPPCYAPDPNL